MASRRTRATASQARHINLEESKKNNGMASSYAAIGAVLPLFLLAVDAALDPSGSAAAAPSTTTGLLSIEDACKQTAELYDLCVATLSPDRSSLTADAAGLTRAAILAVQKNASETATYLSSIDEDDNVNKTAQLQQCLEDCGER
jgi:pectinesterase inhibitor-like protein